MNTLSALISRVKEGIEMNNRLPIELEQTIHPHGGYTSKKLWTQRGNISTYYDYPTDSQCGVPIKSLEELREEVGLV